MDQNSHFGKHSNNLGLQPGLGKYQTVLVSDGGKKLAPEERPSSNWLSQSYRALSIIDNQVGSLREIDLLDGPRAKGEKRAYWSVGTDITKYGVEDAAECSREGVVLLADLATRLAAVDSATQEQLINWGYAVTDAAIRKYVDRTLPAPRSLPFPEEGPCRMSPAGEAL